MLEPNDYVLKSTDIGFSENNYCSPAFMTLDFPPGTFLYFKLQCFYQFQGKEMLVLGDVFMRKYYSTFDREKNRIGIALANHDHNTL